MKKVVLGIVLVLAAGTGYLYYEYRELQKLYERDGNPRYRGG